MNWWRRFLDAFSSICIGRPAPYREPFKRPADEMASLRRLTVAKECPCCGHRPGEDPIARRVVLRQLGARFESKEDIDERLRRLSL